MQDLAGADLNNLNFALPAAELQLLLIQPVPEPSFAVAAIGALALLRRNRRRP